jgi:hypothetical protein
MLLLIIILIIVLGVPSVGWRCGGPAWGGGGLGFALLVLLVLYLCGVFRS